MRNITKKWKPITLGDLPNLQKAVEEVNSWEVHDLYIKLSTENERNNIEILDNTEELYYSGFKFDDAMDKLNDALRLDTDNGAYFDCVCPGRWLADYDNRDRYTIEDVQSHIELAMSQAMCNYMISNGIEYNWTEELRDMYDRVELNKEFMNFFKKLVDNNR